MTNRHVAPEPPETVADRFRDAVSPRSLALGIGVLALQFAFILSYIGAFHAPAPHRIPVTVVAPPPVAGQVVDRLNHITGEPVNAVTSDDVDAAREALRRGETSAVFVVDAAQPADTLLVASGGGTSIAAAVEQLFEQADLQQRRTVTVDDVVPVQPGDARGLSGFYLVVGWAVGGYLFGSMLGIAKGARPANFPRALWRLGATVPYSLLSGLGGALIAGPLLHAMAGHFWPIAGIGALVSLVAAAVTIALQMLFGVFGIGLTVLLFVILGNPSAGGAYQPGLLPPFWRAISSALPNGAGTDAIRRIVYFDGVGAAPNVVVLAIWAVGAVALTVAAAAYRHRRQRRSA
ncbi:ABC transporter permease [Mycobacterium sp. MYCO198283]|uniref:ABC transporter permease n=1 Tax=Mycobacterium sp. MYCO198283 TaxID=2883505 RepID=UPI001E5FF455|nr:ABC transporter permease [Mycobacterium sp. MYCO198283]MCG5432067.1 ABC transporter permease [Mycobacterium sp. MYCO198283]